ILNGLALLQKRGLDRVLIPTDYLEVVKAVQDSQSVSLNSALVKRILQLLQSIGYWRFRHVPREENRVADSLAKMETDKENDVQVF
ncbi:hypothetical protein Gogos_019607, partial [Gossypium gossypioides]|nr:hypothetical protein [Gossypium gossypioides]